ncbi:LysR substrate-binding domain-containing protein [Peribacillus frigoritolerans]|uniref:LysR substrate-binding domain-containing protein n=1 Tax=Peribacillus frigoritolerans TaxID=450367 RepID=UPI002B242A06|nr:LysR substrate-binding domain-containing protein [Peribacillus frigoritolerans]MEB2493305.1 LysR substrate-binding domain-containing protein [Peribacillus frigoritolerans]
MLITDTVHPPISSIKEIQTRTLLVFHSGCAYRERFEQWLYREEMIPNKIMEYGTIDGIIVCAAGLGISMLPQSVITKHIQDGIIRQHSIPNLYGKVKTVFIYRKGKYVTASLIKFINMKCDEEELLDNKRLI